MKKIRIGNDVIVRTRLDEFQTNDKLNIKTLRCLFIKVDQPTDKPADVLYYEPSQYVYGQCGCHGYNAAVYNNGYNLPCRLQDPHWFPGYNGFGVNSNKFKSVPKKYQAAVKVFDDYIEAYFPAENQQIGLFKVVFIAQVYNIGWSTDDLKHMTIDKGDLFMLVNSNDPDVTTNGLIDLTDNTEDDSEKLMVDNIEVASSFGIGAETTYDLLDYDYKKHRYCFEYIKDGSRNLITKDNSKHFIFNVSRKDGNPINTTIDASGTIVCKSENDTNDSKSDIVVSVKSKYNQAINTYIDFSASVINKNRNYKYNPSTISNVTLAFDLINGNTSSIELRPNTKIKLNDIYINNIDNSAIRYYLYTDHFTTDKYSAEKYFDFSSSNGSVAQIDRQGTITIMGSGTCAITASVKGYGDKKSTVQLNIK